MELSAGYPAQVVPSHEDPAVHAFLAGTPAYQVAWLGDRGLPAAVLLPLVNACGQRCFFCAGPGTVSVPPGDVTRWAQVEAHLDARPAGVTRLLVGGNEPTLHPHFDDALLRAVDAGFERVDLMTNGATLGDHAARWAAAGVREVVVPLYGTRAAEHDAAAGVACFDAVNAGLHAAHRAGITVRVHTLLTREVLPQLGELSAFVTGSFGTPLAAALLRPKPVFQWAAHAPSLGEIRRALAGLDVDLLVAPLCLGWGQGDGLLPGAGRAGPPAALLATLYFSTQARTYASPCGACPARSACPGVVSAYATSP